MIKEIKTGKRDSTVKLWEIRNMKSKVKGR